MLSKSNLSSLMFLGSAFAVACSSPNTSQETTSCGTEGGTPLSEAATPGNGEASVQGSDGSTATTTGEGGIGAGDGGISNVPSVDFAGTGDVIVTDQNASIDTATGEISGASSPDTAYKYFTVDPTAWSRQARGVRGTLVPLRYFEHDRGPGCERDRADRTRQDRGVRPAVGRSSAKLRRARWLCLHDVGQGRWSRRRRSGTKLQRCRGRLVLRNRWTWTLDERRQRGGRRWTELRLAQPGPAAGWFGGRGREHVRRRWRGRRCDPAPRAWEHHDRNLRDHRRRRWRRRRQWIRWGKRRRRSHRGSGGNHRRYHRSQRRQRGGQHRRAVRSEWPTERNPRARRADRRRGSAAALINGGAGSMTDGNNSSGAGGGAAGRIRINTTAGAATITGTISPSTATTCLSQGKL